MLTQFDRSAGLNKLKKNWQAKSVRDHFLPGKAQNDSLILKEDWSRHCVSITAHNCVFMGTQLWLR